MGAIDLVFCQDFFDGLKTLKTHTFKFSQLWFTRQILVDGLLGCCLAERKGITATTTSERIGVMKAKASPRQIFRIV